MLQILIQILGCVVEMQVTVCAMLHIMVSVNVWIWNFSMQISQTHSIHVFSVFQGLVEIIGLTT